MSWESWILRNSENLSEEKIIKEYYKGLAVYLKIDNKNRRRDLVWTRFIFFEEVRKKTELSLSAIGSFTGHDHATVMHALRATGAAKQVKDVLYLHLKDRFNLEKRNYEKRNGFQKK